MTISNANPPRPARIAADSGYKPISALSFHYDPIAERSFPPTLRAASHSHPTGTHAACCRKPILRQLAEGCWRMLVNVAGRGRRTDRRTELPVRQQANKRVSVGPSVRATEPEQNVILFGVSVSFSREGALNMQGPHQSNGSIPGPNKEPRDRSLLRTT